MSERRRPVYHLSLFWKVRKCGRNKKRKTIRNSVHGIYVSLKTELEKGMNILPVILNENNEIVAMYIYSWQ